MFNRNKENSQTIKSVKLKPSRFNFIVKHEDHVKLYNSYKGNITKFDNKHKDELINLLRNNAIDYTNDNHEMTEFLLDEGYLVSSNTDEFKKATAQKIKNLSSNRKLTLIILPNEDCNFRCVYCYEDFLKKEIKEPVQRGILNYLKNNIHMYDLLQVSWFGGEPLKSTQIIKDMSKEIMNICEMNNVDYIASITTNGYNLTPAVFEELISYNVLGYQITLDGTEDVHNKYRIGKNGEKTFETIFSNLLQIKETNHEFSLVLRSNVNPEVAGVMPDYIDLIEKNFINDTRFSLHFVAILNLKGEQNAAAHLCDTKDLFPYYTLAKSKGFNFDFYKQHMQPNGSECYAADPNSFVIGSDGMVYKCTVAFNNQANHVGDLLENGDMQIYEERLSLWLTGGANEDSACTKCYFRPSCQGNACPLERIETNSTPCPPIKRNLKKYIDIVEEDLVYV